MSMYLAAPKFGILIIEVNSRSQTVISTFSQLYLTSPFNYVLIILVPPTSIQSGVPLQAVALMPLGWFPQREQWGSTVLWIMLCAKLVAIQKKTTVPCPLLDSGIIWSYSRNRFLNAKDPENLQVNNLSLLGFFTACTNMCPR